MDKKQMDLTSMTPGLNSIIKVKAKQLNGCDQC